MKRLLSILFIISFLLILVLPLSFIDKEKNKKSSLDNRTLTELPRFGDSKFKSEFENYLQDRIGFRNQFVTGYQIMNSVIAKELKHPLYTYGQDGYVFLQMLDNIEFSEYHKSFADAVIKMSNYCMKKGIPFYFMIDPEKKSVYRRYLPNGINYNDEWVDELLSYLQNNGVTVINNKDLLIEKSYSEQVFNKKYDAGHWNDLGRFYGTNNLWESVNKDFPNVTKYKLDEFDISTEIGEYLSNSFFPVNEKLQKFNLICDYEDISENYIGLKQNPSFPFFAYYINRSEESRNYPKMLVFHGSYYNNEPEMFLGRASEYIGIHDYQNVLNLAYYLNVFQPDMVVFEVAEYTINDKYFDKEQMDYLVFNTELYDRESSISDETRYLETDDPTMCCVINGDGFDSVFISVNSFVPKEAYIISDGIVFDLQTSENGFFETAVPHGVLNTEVVFYYIDQDGNTYFNPITIGESKSIVPSKIETTNGVLAENSDFTFTTNLKDNRFTGIAIDLYDPSDESYLELIEFNQLVGFHYGVFLNKYHDGLYDIHIRANSNLHDESVCLYYSLADNSLYYYSYTVKQLDNNRITITDFSLIEFSE